MSSELPLSFGEQHHRLGSSIPNLAIENLKSSTQTNTVDDFKRLRIYNSSLVVSSHKRDNIMPLLMDDLATYQVKTRRRLGEQGLQKVARRSKDATADLLELHLPADLWSISDEARHIFLERGQTTDFYENRIVRAPVFTKYQPLRRLFSVSSTYLGRMVYQMLDCLHDLQYGDAHLLHGDINVSNIMFYELPNGEPHFVFNDFDLATVFTPDEKPRDCPTWKHRTGTLPFLALEPLEDLAAPATLEDFQHVVRYDYESLLWVSLWCSMKMEKVEDENLSKAIEAVVGSWENGTIQNIYDAKWVLVMKRRRQSTLPFTPIFQQWRGWFLEWLSIIRCGERSFEEYKSSFDVIQTEGEDEDEIALLDWEREGSLDGKAVLLALAAELAPPTFDWETAGGTITKDIIVTKLRAAEKVTLARPRGHHVPHRSRR